MDQGLVQGPPDDCVRKGRVSGIPGCLKATVFILSQDAPSEMMTLPATRTCVLVQIGGPCASGRSYFVFFAKVHAMEYAYLSAAIS